MLQKVAVALVVLQCLENCYIIIIFVIIVIMYSASQKN